MPRAETDRTLRTRCTRQSQSLQVHLEMTRSPTLPRLKRKKRDPSPDPTDNTSSSDSDSEPEQTEDVPVLSHAAKRKQKKLEAQLKEAIPSSPPTKKQKKEGGTSGSVQRQNSVWVGNLCYKTTAESLRRFFDGVGGITRVYLPTKLGNPSPSELARRENRGCVSTTDTRDAVFCSLNPNLQFCLCGLCNARGQGGSHPNDRVASRRAPPPNQGRYVNLIFFLALHNLEFPALRR